MTTISYFDERQRLMPRKAIGTITPIGPEFAYCSIVAGQSKIFHVISHGILFSAIPTTLHLHFLKYDGTTHLERCKCLLDRSALRRDHDLQKVFEHDIGRPCRRKNVFELATTE